MTNKDFIELEHFNFYEEMEHSAGSFFESLLKTARDMLFFIFKGMPFQTNAEVNLILNLP